MLLLLKILLVGGCSEGSVENYTKRCFEAIEALHDVFVCPLTKEEKEMEKLWMDDHLGSKGLGEMVG
jgi:hypothetical protein